VLREVKLAHKFTILDKWSAAKQQTEVHSLALQKKKINSCAMSVDVLLCSVNTAKIGLMPG